MRSSRHRYLGRSAKISERLKVEKAPSENGNGHGTVTPPPPVEAPEEPKKKRSRKKQSYSPDELAEANGILAEWFNIVYGGLQVGEVLEWLRELEDVAVDIETYSEFPYAADRRKGATSFVKAEVRLVTLSDGERTYFLDAALLPNEAVHEILSGLAGKRIYCHNGIFDLPLIKRRFNVDFMGEEIRDTMVMSRLTRSGEWRWKNKRTGEIRRLRHDVASVIRRELRIKTLEEADHLWAEPLTEERLTYAQDDVVHLIRLYERLMELVEERELEEGKKLLERVYPFYMRAQYQGVPFDIDLFDAVRERLKVEVANAEADLARHRPEHPEDGETWVWGNSNKPDAVDKYGNRIGRNGALKALSLVGIKLPDLKKSIRVEYLAIHKDEAPLLDALHQYKKFSDLLSDAESWVKFNYEDGRLYPDVKPFSQVTGRSAYANPPLQNIPRALPDELEGVIIESFRDCVRVSQGSRIVKCDYAAQELRIIAAVSGDVNLIESFKSSKDPHLVVGEQIAGKPLIEGTEEHKTYRAFGKRANYGFSYGAGATTYIKSIFEDTSQRVGEDQAKREQEAFQTAWPKVYRWQRQEGARDGTEPGAWFTTSFVGRRRYVGVRYNREGYPVPAYTDRLNGPVQSGGADMLYMALAKLMADQESGYMVEATILFTTHDEITLEVPEEMADEAAEWLSKRMREAAEWFIGPQLGGPDCVEAKVAPSWGGN